MEDVSYPQEETGLKPGLLGEAHMKIEVFGPGCPKCQLLAKVAEEAALAAGVPAELVKVTDIMKIVEAGIMLTPGLKINGKIKSTGRIPKPEEIKKWIEEER